MAHQELVLDSFINGTNVSPMRSSTPDGIDANSEGIIITEEHSTQRRSSSPEPMNTRRQIYTIKSFGDMLGDLEIQTEEKRHNSDCQWPSRSLEHVQQSFDGSKWIIDATFENLDDKMSMFLIPFSRERPVDAVMYHGKSASLSEIVSVHVASPRDLANDNIGLNILLMQRHKATRPNQFQFFGKLSLSEHQKLFGIRRQRRLDKNFPEFARCSLLVSRSIPSIDPLSAIVGQILVDRLHMKRINIDDMALVKEYEMNTRHPEYQLPLYLHIQTRRLDHHGNHIACHLVCQSEEHMLIVVRYLAQALPSHVSIIPLAVTDKGVLSLLEECLASMVDECRFSSSNAVKKIAHLLSQDRHTDSISLPQYKMLVECMRSFYELQQKTDVNIQKLLTLPIQ